MLFGTQSKNSYVNNCTLSVTPDGRLGSRLRGYHPVAPRPLRYGPFVHRVLVPPVISRGTPRQAT
jgi:hypothetical protein